MVLFIRGLFQTSQLCVYDNNTVVHTEEGESQVSPHLSVVYITADSQNSIIYLDLGVTLVCTNASNLKGITF